ncbi:Meiotic Sister-Chromatid recombination aldehyde dehydrogenase [Malassezia psittaci]|uniref:Meiotic Sister-Chromatid recombination aldehyde dehydrogenase n=1 Tax=Malassezia psittaci TaxID=1821823 RepID=A0AAF0FAS2_9BASI|nr:Meiotic Sister-Chromatid recombination aldehyde dehydrogenase [Malassezia psittaci]
MIEIIPAAVVTILISIVSGGILWYKKESRILQIKGVHPEQATPGWKGRFRSSPAPPVVSEGKVHCIDPATGFVLDTLQADTSATIQSKIGAAKEAQISFKATSWEQRRRFLKTLRAWIMRDMEVLARIACRDTGKTAIDAAFGELLTTCAKLNWTLANGEKVLQPETRNLVQLVVCAPEHAEALTRDKRIAHITFIGSDRIGRAVAAAAAPQLTATTLELGGKDPAVILPGTNLEFFASMFLRACFQAMGQNCIGIERWIVPRDMTEALVNTVQSRIASLKCGSFLDDTRFGTQKDIEDVVDCGAMINDARFDQLESLIEDAVKQGARLLQGGRRLQHPRWPLGFYFQPTLLVNVTKTMRIAQEELFAPVFLVMSYDSIQEAIDIANGTVYGLGSSVFGSNREDCLRVADQLECGMVNINDFGISYLNQGLPFGGCKDSGFGRFAGPEGLLGLTRAKSRTEDIAFRWVQTSIPPVVDYPVRNTNQSWQCTSSHSLSFTRIGWPCIRYYEPTYHRVV